MSDSLGIVIPAYRPDIERLSSYTLAIKDRISPTTVRIELDDPQAETLAELDGVPATVSTAPKRRGKGRALTAGFDALETDILAFVDADGSTPVDQLARVLEPVVASEADVSVGSRRHPDAAVLSSQSRLRGILGDCFAWFARRLLPIQLYDYQCGAKAISVAAWEQIRHGMTTSGFSWDIQLVTLADRAGYTIQEVPIEWVDQPGSTVSPGRTGFELARAVVAARLGWPGMEQRPADARLVDRDRYEAVSEQESTESDDD